MSAGAGLHLVCNCRIKRPFAPLHRTSACRSPLSKVLVINDEPLILRELLKGLNAAARSLDNPFGITFIGALTAKEGLALIERDGDVQTAIVDDKLYAVQDTRKRRNGDKNRRGTCRCPR